MSGSFKIYCCDKHGRPFVFRTLDKVRPIAITSIFLAQLKEFAKEKGIPIPPQFETIIEEFKKAEKSKDKNRITELIKQLETLGFNDLLKKIEEETGGKLDFFSIASQVYLNFHGKYIPLKPEEEAKVSEIAYTLLKVVLGGNIDIYSFIESNLKYLTEGLKENEQLAVRIGILSMIYESAKRIYLLKTRMKEIKAKLREVLGECNEDSKIILLGSASKLLAIPTSDVELFIYSENFEKKESCREIWFYELRDKKISKEDFNKIREKIRKYSEIKDNLKREIAGVLGLKDIDLRIGTPNVLLKISEMQGILAPEEAKGSLKKIVEEEGIESWVDIKDIEDIVKSAISLAQKNISYTAVDIYEYVKEKFPAFIRDDPNFRKKIIGVFQKYLDTKERTLFWLFTPLSDGIPINDGKVISKIESEVNKILQTGIKGEKISDWAEWGLVRLRRSAEEQIKLLKKEAKPKQMHRLFDVLYRAIWIKTGLPVIIRDLRSKPYWLLFERYVPRELSKKHEKSIKKMLIGTILSRVKFLESVEIRKRSLWALMVEVFR